MRSYNIKVITKVKEATTQQDGRDHGTKRETMINVIKKKGIIYERRDDGGISEFAEASTKRGHRS